MFDFFMDIGNYGARKVRRTRVGRYVVSTAHTSDEGYETAILDEESAHPVERYADRSLAEEGHDRWCETIVDAKVVTKLGGFGGLVEDGPYTLVPCSDERLAALSADAENPVVEGET